MLADIKKYVAEMNVTEKFNNIMVNADPANMRTYRKKEIEAIIPERDPVYDEIITADWARGYGVTKNIADATLMLRRTVTKITVTTDHLLWSD